MDTRWVPEDTCKIRRHRIQHFIAHGGRPRVVEVYHLIFIVVQRGWGFKGGAAPISLAIGLTQSQEIVIVSKMGISIRGDCFWDCHGYASHGGIFGRIEFPIMNQKAIAANGISNGPVLTD